MSSLKNSAWPASTWPTAGATALWLLDHEFRRASAPVYREAHDAQSNSCTRDCSRALVVRDVGVALCNTNTGVESARNCLRSSAPGRRISCAIAGSGALEGRQLQ